jgi:micrococcal nuclease
MKIKQQFNKLLLLFPLLWSFSVNAAERSCEVTRVVDGDTFDAKCSDIQYIRVRLLSIDSYESKRNNRAYKQAYLQHLSVEQIVDKGHKATAVTTKELDHKQIKLVYDSTHSLDKYGRTLGTVFVDNVNINDKLLNEHPDLYLKY